MKLRPATVREGIALDVACARLQDALYYAKMANSPKLAARIRLAISSAKGAQRHMTTRLGRTERGEI